MHNCNLYNLEVHYSLFFPSVQRSGVGHKDVLKELPVTIRNSRLVNALLCELDTRNTEPKRMDFLGLSTRWGGMLVWSGGGIRPPLQVAAILTFPIPW